MRRGWSAGDGFLVVDVEAGTGDGVVLEGVDEG